MGWSNIYLQLTTGAGPVIGEGMLEGYQTAIELDGFSWAMNAARDPKADKGMSVGGALKSLVGVGGDEKNVSLGQLVFTKRFDVASAQIHTCLDNHLPVFSATIAVLHIKPGGRSFHQPGFVLVATDGYFQESSLDIRASGNGVELIETVKLNFKMIVITYLKRMGKDNVPTNPFIFKKK